LRKRTGGGLGGRRPELEEEDRPELGGRSLRARELGGGHRKPGEDGRSGRPWRARPTGRAGVDPGRGGSISGGLGERRNRGQMRGRAVGAEDGRSGQRTGGPEAARLDLDRERAPRGGDWSTEARRRKKPRADEQEKTRARRRREEAAAAAGRGGREPGRTAAAATKKKKS
jgi:hypothetical protein